MKLKAIAIAAVVAAATGCATYRQTAVATLVCESQATCDSIWQRAQVWVATNSAYRIQLANNNIIQTYGPHENVHDAVAFTITREPTTSGTTAIRIRGSCHPTIYGCLFDPAPLTNQLFHALK